jgi:hypothetical protein
VDEIGLTAMFFFIAVGFNQRNLMKGIFWLQPNIAARFFWLKPFNQPAIIPLAEANGNEFYFVGNLDREGWIADMFVGLMAIGLNKTCGQIPFTRMFQNI